jgi:peptidase T-like protein
MINVERAIAQFMELVQIDSVSLNERGTADYLIKYFTELGYDVQEDLKSKAAVKGASAGNIVVKIPGTLDKPTIMLEAHMDTVEPGNGIKPQISADGKYIVSDGTTILAADDKAGICQILEIEKVLRENSIPHGPLEFVFAIGEEIGILGAMNLDVEGLGIEAKIAYVIDGGGGIGEAITGGPDYYRIKGQITGKAAHAGGEPDKGISSIQVMAEAISNMKLLKIDEDTTTNIGQVICDYPTNVVPEITTFALEVRSLVPEKAEKQVEHVKNVIEAAAKKYNAIAEIEIEKELAAYQWNDESPVLKHFKTICDNHNIPVKTESVRGGTDVSGLAKNGISAIAIAAGGEFAHTLQERLDIASYEKILEQLLWLVTE